MKHSGVRGVWIVLLAAMPLILAACSGLPGPTAQPDQQATPEVLVVTATSGPATEVPPTPVIAEVTVVPTQEATAEPTQAATVEPTAEATAEATGEPAAAGSGDLGMAGNPVPANEQWNPVVEARDGIEWVLVPVGCFLMGWEDGFTEETPEHEVCFDAPFWLMRTEVTNELYGERGPWRDMAAPRTQVTWTDALAYCESVGGRLPTEAEWEYAVSGPNNFHYPMGRILESGFIVHGGNATSPIAVGSWPQNASWVGAVDLLGNVAEWTNSAYSQQEFPYPYNAEDGRENDPAAGEIRRVVRGSSYQSGESVLRASFREFYQFDASTIGIGWRCAADYTAP